MGYFLKNPTIHGMRCVLSRPGKAHLAAKLYRIKNPAAKGHKRYCRNSGRVFFNNPTARGERPVFLRGSNGNKGTITAIATPNPPAGSNATQNQQILQLIPYRLVNLADPYQGSTVIGNPSHVLNGVPQDTTIAITTTANPTSINDVAWIAAQDPTNGNAPRMPHLQATIGAPSGTMVWWKLSVIFHDRNGNPHRDFDTGATLTGPQTTQLTNVNETGTVGYSDDIDVPLPSGSADSGVVGGWVPIAAGTPWNIYQDPDWLAAQGRGFFGGDAELSVKITSSDGSTTILPEQDFYFRIAGENPPADQSTGPTAGAGACQTYITTTYGGPTPDWSGVTYTPGATNAPTVPDYWFAYAISKEETDGNGGRTWYNNFLDNGGAYNTRVPGNEGHPNWQNDGTTTKPVNGTGGYGLFQLTYEGAHGTDPAEANFIMPRDWIWNWKSNVQQFLPIIQSKLLATQSHLNYLRVTYPPPSFVDPTSQTTTASATTFNYWESSAITHYNSGSGWHLTPGSGGAAGTWNYTPNPQNYLYQVAHKGIENHP